MRNLVVLTGAGISAESGINTFRDSGGLWEGHDVMEVASPEGWAKNKALVLDFYNRRRINVIEALPNEAHYELAKLQKKFKVNIITQNVDDLHERAGSKNIVHLHGEIKKSRSTEYEELIYDIKGSELNIGDKCEKGFQLRPHIVWFGEPVPEMDNAISLTSKADIFLVIGTSLAVYPAASLLWYVPKNTPVYYIDPHIPDFKFDDSVIHIREKATTGIKLLTNEYL
jgi:NAD-dependent deacetylase